MKYSTLLLILLAFTIKSIAQDTAIIIVSGIIGEEFDAEEKTKYHLFPYFSSKDFVSAQFLRLADGSTVIRAQMKDGTTQERASSDAEIEWIRNHVAKSPQQDDSDTSSTYFITMKDGSTFHGKIIERDNTTLKVESKTLGIITIKLTDIKEINKVEASSIRGGKVWFPNPNATRYLFGPTAIPLKQGEGYYQNVFVFINSFHVGITDNISIGGGLEPISFVTLASNGEPPPFYITSKVGFQVGEKVHVAGGALFLSFFDGFSGIIYGVGTYGSVESNVTIGTGYGFVDDELAESPIFTFSAMHRVSRKVALVTENWMIPQRRCTYSYPSYSATNCTTEYKPYISYAIRIMEQKTTWDIGFINNGDIASNIIIGIPYVDFVFKF